MLLYNANLSPNALRVRAVAHELVLLCHKLPLTAWTSWQAPRQGVGEPNPDGGDGVGDVAFGTQRRRRGVDNLRVAQVP
jgi:hypothetical protein